MTDTIHRFCRLALMTAREDSREAGVAVPIGLHAWTTQLGANPWYEVRDRYGVVWWEGSTCCKWHARFLAIEAAIKAANSPLRFLL